MNTMYLVCHHHPSAEESFRLAERTDNSSYLAASTHKLQKWLDKHASCGGGFDHFTVAYAIAKDADAVREEAHAAAHWRPA